MTDEELDEIEKAFNDRTYRVDHARFLIAEVQRLREVIKRKDEALERAIGRIERPEIVAEFSIQSKVLDLKEALALSDKEK